MPPYLSKQIDMNNPPIERYKKLVPSCNTMYEKLRKLTEATVLNESEKFLRRQVKDKLHHCLQQFFPDSKMSIYGSTSSNFATKDSDVDILFIPSPEYRKSGSEPDDKKIRSLTFEQLRFIGSILQKTTFCSNVHVISAKCPILKFVLKEKQSTFRCDLSCRNKLVEYNTALLKVFQGIDQRIKPLVITLRLWGKRFGFLNKDGLSSYSLTLLVIFFLQNCDPPILPSVDHLMKLSRSSTIEAGWEVPLFEDVQWESCNKNEDDENELLRKFFLFFWAFDFVRYAVCVRTGKKVPIHMLQKAYPKTFQVSSLCIQDPYDLSHNVGKNMFDKIFQLQPCLWVASNLLVADYDFNEEYVEKKFETLFDPEYFSHEICNHIYISNFKYTCFVPLNQEIINSLGDTEYLFCNWYSSASTAVVDLLQHGLLINTEVIAREDFGMCTNSSCLYEFEDKFLTIQCSVNNRVWIKRPQTYSEVIDNKDFTSEILKKEHLISKSIINENPYLSCNEPILTFNCNIFKTGYEELPQLVVEFSPTSNEKEFQTILKFLLSFVPMKVGQMLLEKK